MRGIRGCMRAIAVLGGIGIWAWLGCSKPEGRGDSATATARKETTGSGQTQGGRAQRERSPNPAVAKRQAVTRANARDVKSQDPGRSLSTAGAIERVLAVIQDSVAFGRPPSCGFWILPPAP